MAYLYNPCQPCCGDPCPDIASGGSVPGCAAYTGELAPSQWRVEFSPPTDGIAQLCQGLGGDAFFPLFNLEWAGGCNWLKELPCQTSVGEVQIAWTLTVESFETGDATLELTGAVNSSGDPITLVFDNRQELRPFNTNTMSLKTQTNLDESLPSTQKICLTPFEPVTCCLGFAPDQFQIAVAGIQCPPPPALCLDCFCDLWNGVYTMNQVSEEAFRCRWEAPRSSPVPCGVNTTYATTANLTITRVGIDLTYSLLIEANRGPFGATRVVAANYGATFGDGDGCASTRVLNNLADNSCDGWPTTMAVVPV